MKEILAEEFAKMDFEGLIKKVVREEVSLHSTPIPTSRQNSLTESLLTDSPPPAREPKRKITARDLGIDEETWSSVYSGIEESANPILASSPDELDSAKPEHVPEELLEQMGVMRDYSSLIEDVTKKPDSELLEAQRKRREMLDKMYKSTG